MPRPQMPDGRRVPVSIKLSGAEAELIDSVRGDLERSQWMREAALSAARGTGSRRPAAVQHGILKRGAVPGRGRTPRTPPPPAPVPSAAAVAAKSAEAAGDCRHPANVRIGDMCGKCYKTVGKKKS